MPANRAISQFDQSEQSGWDQDQRDELNREFIRLLTINHHRLFAFIMTLVGNRHDASDIMQETTLEMWEKFSDFDREQNFLRWGIGFAKIAVRRFHQARKPNHLAFDQELINKLSSTHTGLIEVLDVRREALEKCLGKLPVRQQQLLHACYGEHETIQSAAESLGKSSTALYKNLNRIREKLADCIERTLARMSRNRDGGMA